MSRILKNSARKILKKIVLKYVCSGAREKEHLVNTRRTRDPSPALRLRKLSTEFSSQEYIIIADATSKNPEKI
jgi:hypothetical protein